MYDVYQIVFHTDYAADQLPTNQCYIMLGTPVSPAYCVELSEEGKIFEGWYYTPTYDEGTKIIGGETVAVEGMENWYAKWSVRTVASVFTALANEVREISGVTGKLGIDAMTSNLGEANDEVDEQTTLLNQAIIALQSKAAGGGGTDLEDALV
jgi:hypothetical protein